jgi:hypothetical protein
MKVLKEFKECRHCRKSNWLMEGIAAEERAKGNFSSDVFGCIDAFISCNADLKKPPIVGGRLPAAKYYRDICLNCGRICITRIEVGHMTIPYGPGQPPVFA